MLDCRGEWFEDFYANPIGSFSGNPTFRTAVASHIREVRETDIATWPPLALLGMYRVALGALKEHSSWLELKVSGFHFYC